MLMILFGLAPVIRFGRTKPAMTLFERVEESRLRNV
jgi:hypothetical protein